MTIEAKIAELVDKYERETNKSQSEADIMPKGPVPGAGQCEEVTAL